MFFCQNNVLYILIVSGRSDKSSEKSKNFKTEFFDKIKFLPGKFLSFTEPFGIFSIPNDASL